MYILLKAANIYMHIFF